MGLARWDPFTELRRMREDLDRMFGGTERPSVLSPWLSEGVAPAVDVFDRDNDIVVKANLPGMKREDIDVMATDDSISLSGEFRRDQEAREGGFYRHERQVGKFYRTVPMPAAIKPDEVKASFKDGVLEITAPKAEEAKAKEKKVRIEG